MELVTLVLAALIGLGPLSGCGKTSDDDKSFNDRDRGFETEGSTSWQFANEIVVDGESDPRAILKTYGASCEGECPAGVVGLVSLPKWPRKFIGYCNGFLVAPNLVATAGHCVDSSLLESDCSNLLVAKRHNEEVFCKRVLTKVHRSDIIGDRDIALIELEDSFSTRAGTRKLANKLPGEREEVSVLSFSPEVGGAKFSQKKCIYRQKTLFNDSSGEEQSILAIYGCDNAVVVGNSGSAMVNRAGEVLGIVSFILDTQLAIKKSSGESDDDLLRLSSVPPVAMGVSSRCFSFNAEQQSLPWSDDDACKITEKSSVLSRIEDAFHKAQQDKLSNLIISKLKYLHQEELFKGDNEFYVYNLQPADLVVAPYCFDRAEYNRVGWMKSAKGRKAYRPKMYRLDLKFDYSLEKDEIVPSLGLSKAQDSRVSLLVPPKEFTEKYDGIIPDCQTQVSEKITIASKD